MIENENGFDFKQRWEKLRFGNNTLENKNKQYIY